MYFINPIQACYFYLLRPGGGSLGAPLYNFKTAHDAATKITQSNVLIISKI